MVILISMILLQHSHVCKLQFVHILSGTCSCKVDTTARLMQMNSFPWRQSADYRHSIVLANVWHTKKRLSVAIGYQHTWCGICSRCSAVHRCVLIPSYTAIFMQMIHDNFSIHPVLKLTQALLDLSRMLYNSLFRTSLNSQLFLF